MAVNFPEEIVQIIFGWLDIPDLCSVALTCKGLNAPATPLLYSKVKWRWDMENRKPPITLFLRTVLMRPELGEYVQEIRLLGNDLSKQHPGLRTTKISVTWDEVAPAVNFVETTDLPYTKKWIKLLKAGSMDALVAVLLSRLPRIRHLFVDHNFTKTANLVGVMFQSALCGPVYPCLPRFERLRDVSFNILDQNAPRFRISDTTNMAALFYLPEVKHISTYADYGDAFKWPSDSPPRPVHLTELELYNLSGRHLGEVLSATTNLQRLEWTCFYLRSGIPRSVQVAPLDDLAEALLCAPKTLRSLVIRATLCDITHTNRGVFGFPPRLVSSGSLDGMRNVSNLESVEIPFLYLMRCSSLDMVLPKMLKRLIITDNFWVSEVDDLAYEDCATKVRDWSANWSSWTPELKALQFVYPNAQETWGRTVRTDIAKAGVERGVKIESNWRDVCGW